MRKLPLLRSDLADLADPESNDPRDPSGAIAKALQFAAKTRVASLDSPEQLLGYLYVLEGSTNGGVLLYPHVERALDLRDGHGTSYLRNYESEQTDAWVEFKTRLNGAITTEKGLDQAVTGAQELFACLGEILTAIGEQEDSRRVHATSLNPEAGSHRVPQDERELQVVHEAARICLEELPYITERYGERGERYTASDGAWLATLPDLPEHVVEKQVAWLARFLSALGMPRLTLERHLELTAKLLGERFPENAARYRKLDLAATSLLALRRDQIDPQTRDRCHKEFLDTIGPELRPTFEYVGDLLLSAIADERLDESGALDETLRWIREQSDWPAIVVEASERLVRTLENQEA